MKKVFLLLALAASCVAASAQSFGGSACQGDRVCYAVPNNSGQPMTLDFSLTRSPACGAVVGQVVRTGNCQYSQGYGYAYWNNGKSYSYMVDAAATLCEAGGTDCKALRATLQFDHVTAVSGRIPGRVTNTWYVKTGGTLE